MSKTLNRTHMAWAGMPLCEQRFPKPRLTSNPREVTCLSCKNVARLKLSTSHRDLASFIAAGGPTVGVSR